MPEQLTCDEGDDQADPNDCCSLAVSLDDSAGQPGCSSPREDGQKHPWKRAVNTTTCSQRPPWTWTIISSRNLEWSRYETVHHTTVFGLKILSGTHSSTCNRVVTAFLAPPFQHLPGRWLPISNAKKCWWFVSRILSVCAARTCTSVAYRCS